MRLYRCRRLAKLIPITGHGENRLKESRHTVSAPGHGDVIDKLLGSISDELTLRFAGVFAHETVDRHVRESNQALHRTATRPTCW